MVICICASLLLSGSPNLDGKLDRSDFNFKILLIHFLPTSNGKCFQLVLIFRGFHNQSASLLLWWGVQERYTNSTRFWPDCTTANRHATSGLITNVINDKYRFFWMKFDTVTDIYNVFLELTNRRPQHTGRGLLHQIVSQSHLQCCVKNRQPMFISYYEIFYKVFSSFQSRRPRAPEAALLLL